MGTPDRFQWPVVTNWDSIVSLQFSMSETIDWLPRCVQGPVMEQ